MFFEVNFRDTDFRYMAGEALAREVVHNVEGDELLFFARQARNQSQVIVTEDEINQLIAKCIMSRWNYC